METGNKLKKLKQAQLSFFTPGKKSKVKPSVMVMDEHDKENQNDNENDSTNSFCSRKPLAAGDNFFGQSKQLGKVKDEIANSECIVIESSDTDTEVVLIDSEGHSEVEKPLRKRQRSEDEDEKLKIPTVKITTPTPVKKAKATKSSSAVKKPPKQQKRARSVSPKPNADSSADGAKITSAITPEGTPSKKVKSSEENAEEQISEIKMNESVTSVTSQNSNPDESKPRTSTRKRKKLTPDATKKKEEQARIKEELKIKREKEKLEREKQKEKEKMEREKQKEKERQEREREKYEKEKKKLELKLKKEEVKREKKELEEQIRQEKLQILEEQKRKKQEELLEKQKERMEKEMERKLEKERREEKRKQKEEEKRQKENERLQKQKDQEEKDKAVEIKKMKRANSFKNFFKSPSRVSSPKAESDCKIGPFNNFQLKSGMKLAPTRRVIDLQSKTNLLNKLNGQDSAVNYLKNVKFSRKQIMRSGPTLPRSREKLLSLSDDGLEVISQEDNKAVPKNAVLKAKLIQFHSNCRPPYYGTWRKKSTTLNPRDPFKKDTVLLDYEFDSDDEWEDPGEGEDIAESDEEEEADKDVEKEENDGFFVPHGYLSDDEGIEDDCDNGASPLSHKMKQRQQEFEASFKRKVRNIKPLIIGPVWMGTEEYEAHRPSLEQHKMQFITSCPLRPCDIEETSTDSGIGDVIIKQRTKNVPEGAMSDLIRLVHGNPISKKAIVAEFLEYWKLKMEGGLPEGKGPINANIDNDNTATLTDVSTVKVLMSKAQLSKKIKEIAKYDKLENWSRSCWQVHEEEMKKYIKEGEELPIPLKWNFLTEDYANNPKCQLVYVPPKPTAPVVAAPERVQPEEAVKPAPSVFRIDKFVKKLSPEDILEISKLKHEKEKEIAKTKADNIAKYAVDKLNPSVLIEQSSVKLAQQLERQLARQGDMQSAETPIPIEPVDEECKYVVPTPDAMRTLFKIKDEKPANEKPTESC